MSGPYITIPSHVTALYIFAVVNLFLMLNISLADASIYVFDRFNQSLDIRISDLPAKFGAPIPTDGVWGHIAYAEPHDACSDIKPPPESNVTRWIALIKRHGCDFDRKVLNAQYAGYKGAIVHNVNSDDLVSMGPGSMGQYVDISAAFIGESDAYYMQRHFIDGNKKFEYSFLLDQGSPFNPQVYLLPFAIVVGVCFILMLVFMIGKWVRDVRRRQRTRLSKSHLKKIPIEKFKKGDKYDTCAICLDEFEEGEKLRVLPCCHAYHLKCIDPWLLKKKKTCPICKRKVLLAGEKDSSASESDNSDNDDEGGASENTRLLPPERRSAGGTFDNSGLPEALRSEAGYLSTSEGSQEPSTSVEVHSEPEAHRNRRFNLGAGTTAAAYLIDETTDDDFSVYSDKYHRDQQQRPIPSIFDDETEDDDSPLVRMTTGHSINGTGYVTEIKSDDVRPKDKKKSDSKKSDTKKSDDTKVSDVAKTNEFDDERPGPSGIEGPFGTEGPAELEITEDHFVADDHPLLDNVEGEDTEVVHVVRPKNKKKKKQKKKRRNDDENV